MTSPKDFLDPNLLSVVQPSQNEDGFMSVRHIDALKSRVGDLRHQLTEAERALYDAMIAASPVKVGEIVWRRGEEYRVTAIIPADYRLEKPWLNGTPRKKNGEWSNANRALYAEWDAKPCDEFEGST